MSVQKHDVVAGGGVASGLATIFLTLLQQFPQHLSSGQVETAIAAGATIILGSLGYHGVVSKAQVAQGAAFVGAHLGTIEELAEDIPGVKAGVAEAKKLAGEAVAAVRSLPAPVVADAEQLAEKAAQKVLARLAGAAASTPAAMSVTVNPPSGGSGDTTVAPVPAPAPAEAAPAVAVAPVAGQVA